MEQPVARTYLFVPATRPERVPKALAAHPDGVILDFEDAVAPSDKSAARDTAARSVTDAKLLFIRVNGPDTEWFEEDLKLCADLGALGVLVPKAETADQLRHTASRLKQGTIVLPLVETARGFANAAALCEAPQVQRLVFGHIDFQLDLGIDGERDELLYFRSGLVLASKRAGLQAPADGVTVDIENIERVREDALYAKRLGFGGKLCIHPRQIAPVNECFSPTADEVAWAQRIVAAAGAAQGGAVQVDGKMVDRPVLVKAQAILSAAARTTG